MSITMLLSLIFLSTITTINSYLLPCVEDPNCKCIFSDYYEILFSCNYTAKSNYKFTIIPDEYIQIVCENWERWDDMRTHLHRDIIGQKIEKVNIQHCGISSSEITLGKMLKRLGINETDEFTFNSYKKYYGKISREDLKGLQYVRHMNLAYNGLTNISSTLFEDFHYLQSLDLSHNELKLSYDFFHSTPQLALLDLSYNDLIEFTFVGMFNKLKQLEYLKLNHNDLINLPDGMFNDLIELKLVNISNNKLKTLPDRIFNQTLQLEVIDISNNEFATLPQHLLSRTQNLLTFVMNYNKRIMSTLPTHFFSNLTKLEHVYLIGNKITFLPENLFENSLSLKYIHLDYNYLTTLPKTIFHGQYNLQIISIRNNVIKSLPDYIFQDLMNLERLDLSGNELTHITSDLFHGLTFLKELYLEENEISYIEDTAFNELIVLKIANLSDNKLTMEKHNNWYSLRRNLFLEEFDLSYNYIQNLVFDWTKYGHYLRHIDLSHNQLSDIATNYLVLPSSKLEFDLTYNNIKNINFKTENKLKEYFKNNHEIVILINNNPILCDCRLYDFLNYRENKLELFKSNYFNFSLGNLSCINLDKSSGPVIKNLMSKTYTCPVDNYLTITDNCQTNCDCKIRLYDKTRILDCSNRNLSTFEIDTTKIHDFKDYNLLVNLTGNQLTKIPMFATLETLKITGLLLSNNNISYLSINSLPTSVKILELHNNNITEFKLEEFAYFYSKQLDHFTLSGNPFKCDCNIKELIHLIKIKRILYKDLEKLECFGNPMYMTSEDMLDCSISSKSTVGNTTILIIIIIAILFIIILPWCHKRITGRSLKDRIVDMLLPWSNLI